MSTNRKHHELKTDPQVFKESMSGRKPWEIRRNDRDFQEGDTVTLHETVSTGQAMAEGAALQYTRRTLQGRITWVLHGPEYGLADGWCIFSLEQAGSGEAVDFDEQKERWRHDSEELDALQMNLDDAKVPRADSRGEIYSVWGRVLRYSRRGGSVPEAIKHQARRVRNYSNPNEVFEAIPLSAFGPESTTTPQPAPGPLPYWKPCNPACDPELNGYRDRGCSCEPARMALSNTAPPAEGAE